MTKLQIAPSILSADFSRLGQDLQEAEAAGASWVHIDVMDGQFVPNITIGPLIVEAVKRSCNLYRDVHLMIDRPERYIQDFVQAGAQNITVHAEATVHLHRTVHLIKELGAQAGVALNPGTSLEMIRPVLPDLDLALIMTVNPGFGGQKFIPASLERIRILRGWLDEVNPECHLEVDGGVNLQTVESVVRSGANILVAGSAVFNPSGIGRNFKALTEAACACV
ncbi:ribulose-phosphate 3-epimerase [Deinococcus cellulosilyticus]|uniref:Ribulose-phosphate 3-epimerase n=1 Tax=Deinococcus cellulosilyticus (strain DSM 18568 / NBRC 106333 / KACC 11606 / 5516J-15) TaxID=1223518 RepID=A0A511N1H5_DEIC1|nr:ribulose-phosphate 3-epimerase [Deinococcus cellulosilyticus]GEM46186.1 ribulose-phosphate 3-epimerase [Deinococcus cellulosilyticus NBRC 106333 = KACC 11606]